MYYLYTKNTIDPINFYGLSLYSRYPGNNQLNLDFLKEGIDYFKINQETPIAGIGSCFAAELKKWLIKNNFNFIETVKGLPADGGSAAFYYVYNTYTILQQFQIAFDSFNPIETYWKYVDNDGIDRILDPYRARIAWESFEDMQNEKKEHANNVRYAFSKAKVIVMTLGLSEIWYNNKDGAVFANGPPCEVVDNKNHRFRLTTVYENLNNLNEAFKLVKKYNNDVKFIISLSPVPLSTTYRPLNSVIANSTSKAILRVAADIFSSLNKDVVYFPSYEIATILESNPYIEDNRHIKPETINTIMGFFCDLFVNE